MSASILDPRMIDQLKPLTVSNTNFINITSALISVPGATSNNWTESFNIVKNLSSDWNSTFNLVQALSSDWEESLLVGEISATNADLLTSVDDLYTFLETNSANWEESADILPTVTNYLSTSNVQASALSLSSVTFTNRFTVATTLTATTTVLEVLVNGTSKYLPLFDIN